MINYSVIIPHKNIPDLLERCLASIPRRDDLQIIIVDDGSDPSVVDFDNFPGADRPGTEIIFKKGDPDDKGPGRARNDALKKATGKWITFVDADDFMLPAASALMDKYAASEADIVFMGNTFVDSDTLAPVGTTPQGGHIEAHLTTGDDTGLRYLMNAPWGKFTKKQLIDRHDIRFGDEMWGEDMIFAVMSGHFAESIESDRTPIYGYTRRPGGLTALSKERRAQIAPSELGVDIRVARFLLSHGAHEMHKARVKIALRHWKELMRIDRRLGLSFLPVLKEVCPPAQLMQMRLKMAFDPLVSAFKTKKH